MKSSSTSPAGPSARSGAARRAGSPSRWALLAWLLVLTALVPAARGADGARQITWDDLLPEGWTPPVQTVDHFFDLPAGPALSAADAPVVPAMNGQHIRLPGYLVPIELEGQLIRSFLMVPYFGACIHVPPPPPNQVVFVRLEQAIRLEDPYGAHWVTGTLSTEQSTTDLAEAAYTMRGERVEVFDWDALYQEQAADPG